MYYSKKLWGVSGGGGVVLNFVPFVAPESFNDPSKYADFGCTVNLHEKLSIYKMTYPGADIAVEFSDAISSVDFNATQIQSGSAIEIFESVSGVERSVLYIDSYNHTFTSGSTKRYMIRRSTPFIYFTFPIGSVWAYCFDIQRLTGWVGPSIPGNPYLKYIFFHENTLRNIGPFINTALTGVLTVNDLVKDIGSSVFSNCTNLTKVIAGYQVATITGNNNGGAFLNCTSLQVADLGEGITSIGTDTFVGCSSLASIICRAYNPPILRIDAFRDIPTTTNFYVPHERVNVYKAANGWAEFASRIYSINDL